MRFLPNFSLNKFKNSLLEIERRQFLAFSIGSISLIYIILYSLSLGSNPFIGDDINSSLLTRIPNIALQQTKNDKLTFSPYSQRESLKSLPAKGVVRQEDFFPALFYSSDKGEIYPLLHENKQGGWAYIVLRSLIKLVGPESALHLWHLFCAISALTLFLLLLENWKGRLFALFGTFVLCFDPLFISLYGPSLIEKSLIPLFLLSLYIARKNSHQHFFLAGVVLGLAFSIKITILWFALTTLLIYRKYLSWKKLFSFGIGFSLLFIPYTLSINFDQFGAEVLAVDYSFYFPFKEIFHAFFNKGAYLESFTHQEYRHWYIQQYGYNLKGIDFSLLSFMALGLLTLPWWGKRIKVFHSSDRSPYWRQILTVLCFAYIITVSLLRYDSIVPFPEYLFPLSLPYALYIAYLLLELDQEKKVGKLLVTAGCIFILIQSLTWIYTFRKSPILSHYNLKTLKEITHHLKELPEKPVYTISRFLISPVEILSDEKIWPIHLYKLPYDNLIELIEKLPAGRILINLTEPSEKSQIQKNPAFNRKEFEALAVQRNILLNKIKTFPKEGPTSQFILYDFIKN